MLYCVCISNFTQFLLYLKGSLLAVGTYNNEIEQFIYTAKTSHMKIPQRHLLFLENSIFQLILTYQNSPLNIQR